MRKDEVIARVIGEFKGIYKVRVGKDDYLARTSGKMIFDSDDREDYPAVGDWVEVSGAGEGTTVIRRILPRKTVLAKKSAGKHSKQIIAANVDIAFIVESVGRDFSLNRLDRYVVLAKDAGIEPVIVLNKIDLAYEAEVADMMDRISDRFPSLNAVMTSTVTGTGLDLMKIHIESNTMCCFLGSSGVGKSSLINALLGREEIKVREISASTGRGKHTTTARDMYFLGNGGAVVDNPGMREVGLIGVGLDGTFSDISRLAEGCRFTDCTHNAEPGCAVLEAISSGRLDKEQYDNFLRLKKESAYYTMKDSERRVKDRRFGKFIKNAKKDIKRYR